MYVKDFSPNSELKTPDSNEAGEMTELAEGARLEIVCSAKSGTVGSNPTLSAMHHVGYMAALNST